jgi:hypothetical protein
METPPPPSVWSDKADYAPGQTVTLSGANWAPGESVHIRVNDDAGQTWSRDVDVTAAEDGTISDQFNLPGWFVAFYNVAATGASGTATWSFTDAVSTTTAIVSSLNPSSFGNSVTFTATVTCATPCAFPAGSSVDFVENANNACNGGTTLGSTTTLTGSGNSRQATFTTSSLAAGTHSIRACFNTTDTSGNNAQKSTSNALSQVVNANTAPVCNNGSATTAEDNPVATTLSCTDADGNSLTYTIVSGPAHGTLSGTAPNLTYSPALDYNGSDNFTFKANDGSADSNVATFSLTINAVNDVPVCTDGSATTDEDTPKNITFSCSDVDGDSLTYSVMAGPSHGSVSSGTSPNRTYSPALNYNGSDSFTFKANDGSADSNVATFSLTINAVNDAPTATVSLNDHSPKTNDTLTATATRADVDGDAISLHYVWKVNGTVKRDVTKSVGDATDLTDSFNLAVAGNGDKGDTIRVEVTPNDGEADGATASDEATVVNSAPAATVSLNDHSPKTNDTLTATATRSDDDGDAVSLHYVWKVNGTVKRDVTKSSGTAGDLTDSFDLSLAGNGDKGDEVKVKVTPDDGTVNGAAVYDTATVVNSKPSITSASASPSTVDEGSPVSFSGSTTDPDGDTLEYDWDFGDGSSSGWQSSASASHTYEDGPNNHSAVLTVRDNDGATDSSAGVAIHVNNVAPKITSLTGNPSLAGMLVFGTPTTFNGSFDDPGVKDYTWTLDWSWDGVLDSLAAQSITSNPSYDVSHAFSQTHKFTTAGCSHTGTVKATDKDGGNDTKTATVQVGTGEFLAPMTNQPVTDKLKNGQVLPVKVRIADCSGNPIAGLSPSIVLKSGDLTVGVEDSSTMTVPVDSVSAADTNGVMRSADGFYIYNMRVSLPNSELNRPYTVVITPGIPGYGAQTLRHRIIVTK